MRGLGVVCVARQPAVPAPLGEAHRPALVEATALAGAFERRLQKADRENLLPNRADSTKLWSLMAPDQKIL